MEAAAPPLILAYQFRVGDDRCSRDAFLRFAIERLQAGMADHAAPEEDDADAQERLTLIDRFKARLRTVARHRRVVVVLDGLDEVAERDATFAAQVPLAHAVPGVTWLCVGRPERSLPEVFQHAAAREPFPGGLPPMRDGDVRTMLLEKVGPLRTRLLKGDRDAGEAVVNPFITRVAANAHGLPLYVTYVVGDVLAGKIAPDAVGAAALPPSLAAYHERLLERCEVGDLRQVLPPLVGTLAVAREPLTGAALADLLARRTVVRAGPDGEALVRQALAAIGTLVRRELTPEGEDGFTLFHHSFRAHVLASARTTMVVATAREALAEAACAPGAPQEAAAARYLFRHGVGHLVEAGRAEDARALLTDFAYVMARLQALQPGGADGVGDDWQAILASGLPLDRDARLWEAFVRERAHLLRRGTPAWPASESSSNWPSSTRRQPGHPPGRGVGRHGARRVALAAQPAARGACRPPPLYRRPRRAHGLGQRCDGPRRWSHPVVVLGSHTAAMALRRRAAGHFRGAHRVGHGREDPGGWPDPVLVFGSDAAAVGRGRRAAGHPHRAHPLGGGGDGPRGWPHPVVVP